MTNLPSGSKIQIQYIDGQAMIILPSISLGVSRYFSVVFLLFWLSMWAGGWLLVAAQILQGKGQWMLIIWFVLWTIGGGMAMTALYRLIKKPKPEKIILNKPYLTYDPGVRIQMGRSFKKEANYITSPQQFTREDLKTLKLRETNDGNRLTLDSRGSERIDIAHNASEIEREWLYQYLKKAYLL